MSLLITNSSFQLIASSMVGMMILYAVFSYVIHRQPTYLYYSLYMGAMLLYVHARSLSGQQMALQGWTTGLESVAFLFYIQFATSLMQIRQNDAWSYRVLQTMAWVLGISGLLSAGIHLAQASTGSIRWVHLLSRTYLVGCTGLILPRLTRVRHASMLYFVAGTALFISFSTVALIHVIRPDLFSISPDNAFTYPLTYMQLGIVLEVLCYTMGISVQNRQIEQEKIHYQARLIEQLRENQVKQNRLNSLRDEIARDLHDEMGSQLSSISILSQTTTRYVTDDRARQRLLTIGQTARQVMESMREIVWSLNSSSDSLQHVGLRIHETALSLFGESNVKLQLDLPEPGHGPVLTEKQRRDLHLIAKECLTNVLRHAQARTIWISLRDETRTLVLTIRDDGNGFCTGQERSGLGLSNLHQRAGQLRATLHVESEPGAGTIITLACPLSTKIRSEALVLDEISA